MERLAQQRDAGGIHDKWRVATQLEAGERDENLIMGAGVHLAKNNAGCSVK